MSLIILLLCIISVKSTISPLEILFICNYQNVDNFPVPCSDGANACKYAGIECDYQNGSSWNETITGFTLIYYPSFFNGIDNALPTEIGYLTSLRYLSMDNNDRIAASTIPTEIGLCNLTYLSLTNVYFAGTIPSELFKNTMLKHINLTNDFFVGTIPSEINLLTNLEYLNLHFNRFDGNFPPIPNLINLQILDLSSNNFTGPIPDLSKANFLQQYLLHNNEFIGRLPSFNSTSLNIIDISENNINGPITSTTIIQVSNSYFIMSGKSNLIQGTIPNEFFLAVPSLLALDLSYNLLSGTLSSQITSCIYIEQLILSHNQLSGQLPIQMNDFLFPFLYRLSMGYNMFSGPMPRIIMKTNNQSYIPLSNVSTFQNNIYLNLNSNNLSGDVPELVDFSFDTSIDLSNNMLSLYIDSFGIGANITWINMAGNNLGYQPVMPFFNIYRLSSLITLDISNANLSGIIPQQFRVRYLKMNNNLLTGVVSSNIIIPRTAKDLPAYVDVRLNRLDSDSTRNTFSTSLNSKDNSIILNDWPQDVDDCLLDIDNCEQICSDGWYPIGSYTCDCYPGYKLDEINKRNCTVICGDGLLKYPDEECDFVYSPYGCNPNCTTKNGYQCDASGCNPICGDNVVNFPEQCDNNSPGCSNCTITPGYTCENNICQLCSQNWIPFIYPNNLILFPKFRELGYNLSDFPLASCITCNQGISLETREVSSSAFCNSVSSQQSNPCSFACSNLTVFSSAIESIYTLKQELEKGSFLNIIFNKLFNTNITITINKKRDGSSQLDFNITSCNQNTTQMINVIQALSLDITPNIPLLELNSQNCSINLLSTNPTISTQLTPSIIVGMSIGIICGILIIIIVCIISFYYYRSELHELPDEVAWSFKNYLTNPWLWSYHGDSKNGYYSRTYSKDSNEFNKVNELLKTYFKKGSLVATEITAVYNHSLTVSFINQWKIMIARKEQSPEQFFSCTYTKNKEKMEILEHYQKNLVDALPYNKKLILPIIPTCHGTDHIIAQKIAETGFCALSSLDGGYYCKGIYFTNLILYTLPYACMKRIPSVVIAYVNPGNVYAVNEDHKGNNSLLGASFRSGYNSNYVLTNKDGNIYNKDDKNNELVCNELVIGSENQIVPAFVIKLDLDSCMDCFEKWQRAIAQPVNDAAIKFRDTSSISQINLEYTSTTIVDMSEIV